MPPTKTSSTIVANAKTAGKGHAAPAKMKSPNIPTLLDIMKTRPYTFNFDTLDGSFVVYYTDGGVNYADVIFLVNGILPENGSRIRIADDNMSVIFERAIHSKLFTKFTLKAIMESDCKNFNENSNCTVEYDNTTTQQMRKNNIVPDTNDYYWGQQQVVPLKAKCTGNPDVSETPWYSGEKIHGQRQFNSIFLCTVTMAEQRVSTKVLVSRKRAVDFGFGSQESDGPPSPPEPRPRRSGYAGGFSTRCCSED